METKEHFGAPRDEERAAVADIIGQAFGGSPADSATWMQRSEETGAHPRVLREDGAVAATLTRVPMGQWWGGKRVPTDGIAAVGVAPERRGRGTATRLMQEALREARALGLPLSTLYPATQPLYRRVGYEQAGARFEVRTQAAHLDFSERSLSLRPIQPADAPAVRECYRLHARQQQGWLERGDYIWHRVLNPRCETAYGYLVEGAQGVEGYVYLVRRRRPHSHELDLALTDLVALTPAAGRRLLSFLGDHRSVARDVLWQAGPAEPLLLLMREQTYQVRLLFHWMVRLVDVPAALVARGYPEGVSGALHLEVEDSLLPENHGRFVLEVEGGQGRVRPGGEGALRLEVGALASLYSGLYGPAALRAAGRLQADDASVRVASALFSGPMPCMPDMF